MKQQRQKQDKQQPNSSEAPADHGDIVELDEAFRMLHTSRTTLYRWIREGRIRAMKAGRQWRFRREDIDHFLSGEAPKVSLSVSVDPLIEALKNALSRSGASADDAKEIQDSIEPIGGQEYHGLKPHDPMAEVAALLLHLAVHENASDIHIAPFMEAGRSKGLVRLRKDGVLHATVEFDYRLLSPLSDRLKTMAGCDVLDTGRPQDGRILLVGPNDRRLDLRTCFLPLGLGPSVTIRVLRQNAGDMTLSLDAMGYNPSDRERIDKAMQLSNGLVLFTGPAGSGKSTSLYAGLASIAGPHIKVMSIEDPIEFYLPWVDQVQVNPVVGLGFTRAIRSILRSDPDVLLCGEIRDLETAQLCIQTALTGHLVFSTLHTQDATGALIRMVDIGVEPFLVGDCTKLIVAQRLIRRLCPECARNHSPSLPELRWARQALLESGVNEDEITTNFKEPGGCPRCGHSGFRGRGVIAETLAVPPDLARFLRNRAPYADLKKLAINAGMTTIAADAARKAYEGTTSLQEAYRVAASAVIGL